MMTREQRDDVWRRAAHLRRWADRKFGKGRGFGYRPEELPPSMRPGGRNAVPTNDELSAAELFDFMADDEKPGRWIGYLARCVTGGYKVTNSCGEWLATIPPHHITFRPWRKGYTTNTRGTFRATGRNGVEYVGTHNGVGVFCRMRPAKTTRRKP
jgi:hypothetical protein